MRLIVIFFHAMFFSYAVEEILSDQSREKIVENIHAKLEEIGKKVKDGDYPLDVYIINKVFL